MDLRGVALEEADDGMVSGRLESARRHKGVKEENDWGRTTSALALGATARGD